MSDIREHEIAVGDLRIHTYLRRGAGEATLVFLHGWGSSGRMWLDSFDWVSDLGTCLALDLPGHGRSARPPFDWFSLENLVVVVRDLLAGMGVAKPVLIGHSLGGALALAYAATQPDALSRLVVVAPAVSGRVVLYARWAFHPAFFGPLRAISSIVRPAAALSLRSRLLRWAAARLIQPFRLRDLEDYIQSDPQASLATAVIAARSDLTDSLGSICAPSLIVVGRQDLTVPPEEGRRAAQRIPGSLLVELPTRHHPFNERPDLFFPILRSFLQS
jgi:pimeloyl-ACP methyl ester carboxylesterase